MKGSFHHLDLSVRDIEAAVAFYEPILAFLGYHRVKSSDDVVVWHLEPDGRYVCSLALRPAHSQQAHDRYTAGLHHVAWTADSRESVDALHALLASRQVTILDPPADYPKYGPVYYSVFFADPDGLKLEYVHTGE